MKNTLTEIASGANVVDNKPISKDFEGVLMPSLKTSTIIGSNKGGVGKTMVSLLLSLIYRRANYPLRIVEIDNERKLSAMLGNDPNIHSVPATQDIEEIANNRFAAESQFNEVFDEWMKGDSLTDLGANMTEALFSWFRYCHIDELAIDENIRFRFVACASPDGQALRSALDALKAARQAIGNDTELFLVLNDISGGSGFTPYETNADFIELMKMRDEVGLRVINIPYCASVLSEFGRAMNLNPIQIIERITEIAAAAKLDYVSTAVHKKKLMKWLEAAGAALEPLLEVEVDKQGQAA